MAGFSEQAGEPGVASGRTDPSGPASDARRIQIICGLFNVKGLAKEQAKVPGKKTG